MHRTRLAVAWSALVALTAVAGASADLDGHGHLPPASLAIIAGVTVVKSRLILSRYLRLGALPSVLNGFTIVVAALLLVVTASYLVPR